MVPIPFAVRAVLASFVLASTASAAHAARFTDLHDFTANPDGREPSGGVVALNGLLYGTTSVGGTSDAGCIYSLDPATGAETVLYSFTGAFGGQADGSAPAGELLAIDGVLYGTTAFGGQSNGGTLFRFDPASGTETVLYSFGSGTDALMPSAGLVASGSTLYGTSAQGGASGLGTVFSFDLASKQEAVLHEFAGGSDGSEPFAPLTVVGSVLYGTTFFGGASNDGTVFRIDPATRATTVVHAFPGASFSGNPAAGLVLQGGLLYGTTSRGGRPHCSGSGCGTVFSVDVASGKTKSVYRFRSRADGFDPEGGLVVDQGKLYGTTTSGGRHKNGTVFSIDLASQVKTTLHSFTFSDGANPGTLVEVGTNLFGTTHSGGGAAEGTVFRYRP